nr:MAG TPA: hypothetical protein [Caudoviricetes sp.]
MRINTYQLHTKIIRLKSNRFIKSCFMSSN